ncbi:MAG: hypothetical protein WC879_08345 [Melioribacteraceae bacterium]
MKRIINPVKITGQAEWRTQSVVLARRLFGRLIFNITAVSPLSKLYSVF